MVRTHACHYLVILRRDERGHRLRADRAWQRAEVHLTEGRLVLVGSRGLAPGGPRHGRNLRRERPLFLGDSNPPVTEGAIVTDVLPLDPLTRRAGCFAVAVLGVDAADLSTAIERVAEHRKARLATLAQVLDRYAELGQTRWAAWRRRQRLDDRLPLEFDEVLATVKAFADPVIDDIADGSWSAARADVDRGHSLSEPADRLPRLLTDRRGVP